VARTENRAIGGNSRVSVADAVLEPKLYPVYLLDALVAEICVLRREGRLWINTRNVGIQCRVRIGIQIDTSRLADCDFADIGVGDESTQVHLTEVEHSYDRGSGLNHLSGLRRPGYNRAIEGSANGEVLAVRLRLR